MTATRELPGRSHGFCAKLGELVALGCIARCPELRRSATEGEDVEFQAPVTTTIATGLRRAALAEQLSAELRSTLALRERMSITVTLIPFCPGDPGETDGGA